MVIYDSLCTMQVREYVVMNFLALLYLKHVCRYYNRVRNVVDDIERAEVGIIVWCYSAERIVNFVYAIRIEVCPIRNRVLNIILRD